MASGLLTPLTRSPTGADGRAKAARAVEVMRNARRDLKAVLTERIFVEMYSGSTMSLVKDAQGRTPFSINSQVEMCRLLREAMFIVFVAI
jgi:hypothetical protein